MRYLLTILFSFALQSLFSRTIIVGPGQNLTSLKKAIEIAKDKDSIILLGGVYKKGRKILT